MNEISNEDLAQDVTAWAVGYENDTGSIDTDPLHLAAERLREIEELLEIAYDDGYFEGHHDGYEEGYEEGRDIG